MSISYKHLIFRRDSEGIVWLYFDQADASTNVLSSEILDELEGVINTLEQTPPKGLIFASAKTAGFIAGANIEEFSGLESSRAVQALVDRGWQLFDRIANLRFPTLALIQGHCMGGGLELSLACRYRVVVDAPTTRLALPEVMLGIVPAWGGMKRLPALIGPAAALDMMLTGRAINARKARKLGLADECVPVRVMENTAKMVVTSGRSRRQLPMIQRLLNGPLKSVVVSGALKKLKSKARQEHYPAPYSIIDIWSNYDGNALAVPASAPSSLETLFQSKTAKNLIRVFFLQEKLKSFAKQTDFAPKRVHVIGAGVMGGDIAAVCAQKGMIVTLQDQSVDRIAPAIARAGKLFARKFRDRKREAHFALDRLIPDPEGHGVPHADVIIEAIFENLEAKQQLFIDLEKRARPDAVLATNTSSLKIEDIAGALQVPSRLVGIHFFNPVAQMPLVEVVKGAETDARLLEQAASFVGQLDKLPLQVQSSPGFLVNAVLGPYMLEALRCIDEGYVPETIDDALLAFGMPMGPIELVDTVGLDIAVVAGAALTGADENSAAPKKLIALHQAGKLGKKSGEGFYRWEKGKAVKAETFEEKPELADRIVAPLLAATQRCVAQDVVANADLADAGVIFGTGFAPFRGGPMHYLATKGEEKPEMTSDTPVASTPSATENHHETDGSHQDGDKPV